MDNEIENSLGEIILEVEMEENCAFIPGRGTMKLLHRVWQRSAEAQREACYNASIDAKLGMESKAVKEQPLVTLNP